ICTRKNPPITDIKRTTKTYATTIFIPNIIISKIKLTKSNIGEDIKNEKVTPKSKPALVKPINIGIEEQEQNGVTVPNNADIIFAQIPLNFPSIFLLRSGGK